MSLRTKNNAGGQDARLTRGPEAHATVGRRNLDARRKARKMTLHGREPLVKCFALDFAPEAFLRESSAAAAVPF
jgi:hypothetical protein